MREPQFLARLQIAETRLSRGPDAIGIPINWMEGEAFTVEIRIRRTRPTAPNCKTRWNRDRRQGQNRQAALDASAQKLFIIAPEGQAD